MGSGEKDAIKVITAILYQVSNERRISKRKSDVKDPRAGDNDNESSTGNDKINGHNNNIYR